VGNFQTIDGNPLLCSAFNASGVCTAGLAVQDPSLIPAGITPCSPTAALAGAGKNAAGRVDCNFTNLRIRNNGAWSKYNGLQNELKFRNVHGLSGGVAYTWSKALDNTSEIFSSSGGISTPIAQNPFDPNVGERGISAQSFPQVVTTYWVYDLPFMKNQHGVLGHLLGGWQWSGTHRYQSGAPITPDQATGNTDPYCDNSFNSAFIGLDSCRPILSNPNAPFDTSGRYVNPTQLVNVSNCASTGAAFLGTSACPFITPSQVHFIVNNTNAVNALCGGNPFACDVSRNVYRAMPRNQVDLSLAKSIKLHERVNLQLRMDALNVFNYQYLGVSGLNANNKNINGIGLNAQNNVISTPGTFGETWNNGGTNRSLILNAHISF
jgi:hypothetical protein